MPSLSTVCEHPSDIDWISAYNWDTIFIDCSWCSIRPFNPYDWSIEDIIRLKPFAKNIGIHVDGLYTQHELDLIQLSIAPFIEQECFDTIRIQDPGLIAWIQDTYPMLNIHINAETGMQNESSIIELHRMGANRITLNSDTPFAVIQQFCSTQINGELLVQGPLLIQYSKRQFISNWNKANPNQTVHATDAELPHRKFTFLNTQFGHFMFAHFHRCLATVRHKLMRVSAHWFLDVRGQSKSYKRIASLLYHQLNMLSDEAVKAHIDALTTESGFRQLPGFFLVNHTDTDWRNFKSEYQSAKPILGEVISVHAKEWCVIEWHTAVQLPQTVMVHNRDQSNQEWLISNASSTTGALITNITPQLMTVHPWRSGIHPKAVIQAK